MDQKTIDNILHWREIWADNSDPEDINKGILCFSRKICDERIDDIYGIGDTHKVSYKEFLDLYSPGKKYVTERQLQIKEPRGFAKSTRFLYVIPLYLIAFNGHTIKLSTGEKVFIEEDFIVLASETASFAVNWTMSVRATLATNTKFMTYFGRVKLGGIRDENTLWRKDTFICNKKANPENIYKGKNLIIGGRGVGQQTRGYNIIGRPSLIVFDDLYSKNNIITVDSRAKTKYWFDNEAINTLDHNKGKAVLVGTMLHEDTVFTDNENSSSWKCLESPVMDEEKFNFVLENHCVVDRDNKSVIIPDSGTCDELEKQGYFTNWRAKFSLEFLLQKFRAEIERGNESGFWQEFFHRVIAEADKQIKPHMFQRPQFQLIQAKVGEQMIPFIKHYMPDGKILYKNVNLMVAIDTAISDKETADDTAIVWLAMTSRRELYVIETRSGKMGIRDNIKQEFYSEYGDRRKLVKDRTALEMVGMVDETFRMIGTYNPKVVVEVNKTGTNTVRAFRIACKDFSKRLFIIEYVARGNKAERILDALLPYYESRSVYHVPGMVKLEHQLEYIKKVRHDDEADAEGTGVLHIQPPPEIPYPVKRPQAIEDQRAHINRRYKQKHGASDDWTTRVLPR